MCEAIGRGVKERDGLRSDIGNSTHMLMSGIDKISGKKYTTGLPAVAYGLSSERMRLWKSLLDRLIPRPSQKETREQMDQRNYEIAIEISSWSQIGG
ncbi:myosin-9 [Prunus yedoensis var. nudiflora]|uniref:Myosin-9 n=1 Tax=Prunus yedoensis var. nudiflora TaxID=2094558 RepID=A0A314UD79_PRUYE|nr:myosin-9 [Prunus yedoensis var. nudiflora]